MPDTLVQPSMKTGERRTRVRVHAGAARRLLGDGMSAVGLQGVCTRERVWGQEHVCVHMRVCVQALCVCEGVRACVCASIVCVRACVCAYGSVCASIVCVSARV